MRGVKLGVLRATHMFLNEVAARRRRDGIFSARDHQHGHFDCAQLIAKICITHSSTIGGIALGRSGRQHIGDALGLPGIGLGEVRGKPAGNGGITQPRHRRSTLTQNHLDARIPDRRLANFGSRVAHHQLVQPRTGMDPQPLANQSTHRQPAKMRALDMQRIQQRQNISAQLFNAIRSFGHQRLAMTPGVVAQYLEVLGERRNLRVPHPQISAQGIGQHQHRCTLRAVQAVVEFTFSELYTSHEFLL